MSGPHDPIVGAFTSEDEYSAWRAGWLEQYTLGLRLEAAARATGLPFEPRPGWGPPGSVDWSEVGATIQDFAAMVKRTTAVLGPPSEVKSGEGRGGYAPDLLAYWHHPGIVYSVRALIPAGCKLDPRSPEPISWAEHEERAPKLHPECKAVLAELEDL